MNTLSLAIAAQHAVRPPAPGDELALRSTHSAGLGFWSLDPATGLLTSTEHFRQQFGRPAAAAFDYQAFLAALEVGDRVILLQALNDLAQGCGVLDIECRIAVPGGGRRWLRLAAEPATAQGGAGRVVGICLDITEQKKVQEQTMRLYCAGELAAGIGHDLNNLLAIAILCLKRVQVRVSPEHPARPLATEASHALLAAAGLARSFLSLAGGRSEDLQPVQVDRLLRSCLELLRHAAGAGVVLSHEAGALDVHATVQPEQLKLALINLALNARDAMFGGGTLVVRTRVIGKQWVVIDMTDNGVGMTPDQLTRVFEPFFTTKPEGQGTGLGLSQVREMARRCGGDASIQSAPGRGTTVTLRLPATLVA